MSDDNDQEPTDPREILAPLLLHRFRLLLPVVALITFGFGVVHVWMQEERLGFLLALKVFQVAVGFAGLAVSSRIPRRAVIVASLLTLATAVNVVTAITGAIIGNINTNALVYVLVVLTGSSFLPWGVAAQAFCAAGAMAAAMAPPLLGAPLYHDIWYDFAALGSAFFVSCFIARQVERETLEEYRARRAVRALADSRAEFEGVFRATNVSLGLFEVRGDDFVFLVANDFLAGLFHLTPDTIAGRSGEEVGFSRAEVERWLRVFDRCAIEGAVRLPEYRLDVFPPVRWYEVSISAILDADGGQHRFSIAAVDITARKQAADDVDRLNRSLEAKVRERTAELESANKDLESFAYSVSHDLRTPLRSIEGFATLLSDEDGAALSAVAAERVSRIAAAARHMAHLIDDMLTLSRVGRGELRPERVDVTSMASAIVADLARGTPGRAVEVVVAPGLVATADARLLGIVLGNLLANAWKYTSRCERARIELGGDERDGETRFFVKDDGCGFDMRFADKLFQPFQRLHSIDEYEGTGIGLATVARILRRHHGRAWAEGEPGRGATFHFALPEGSPPDSGLVEKG